LKVSPSKYQDLTVVYIFKKDDTIVDKFENSDELLNGLFKIISNYSHKYIQDKNTFEMPESMKQAKTNSVLSLRFSIASIQQKTKGLKKNNVIFD